jgi:hypothetical protein
MVASRTVNGTAEESLLLGTVTEQRLMDTITEGESICYSDLLSVQISGSNMN